MGEVHTEEGPKADILVLIEGRARYLAHLGHVKTPEILRGCAAEITRLRAALAEKMVVRAKPLVFSEFKAGGCVGRPYEFQYFVTEQHNGMFFAHFDESSHDTLEAAKAHCQSHYQAASLESAPMSTKQLTRRSLLGEHDSSAKLQNLRKAYAS